MSAQNGSTKSPAKTVARSVAELGHDAVTLAELQVELLQSEVQQWLRAMIAPALLLLVAIVVSLGSVPVLLTTLASFLVQLADLTPAASLLIASLIGLAIAAVTAIIGIRRIKNNSMTLTLTRSRAELQRNISWMKQVLKHKSSPPDSRCR